MRKIIVTLLVTLALTIRPTPAKADLFGGDVAVLTQILANAIQQLTQLRQVVGAGQNTLSLLNDVNSGLSGALNLINTVSPYVDPGIYKNWTNAAETISELQQIYGIVAPSSQQTVQMHTDQNIAEAIAMNNAMYKYSDHLDSIGERIKSHSQKASPKGAQKLTAETLGVILQAMNQNLRAQATSLKLQAQALALENNYSKARTRYTLSNSAALEQAIKKEEVTFSIPRF